MPAAPPPPVLAIGRLFQDLRRCLGLSDHQIAMHLQTTPGVIRALELGAFEQLPPWPEICRVVSAYTLLANIDPQPVLQSIGQELATRAAVKDEIEPEHSRQSRFATVLERIKAVAAGAADVGNRARHGASRMSRPTALIVIVAVGAILTGLVAQTTMLQAAAGALPSPVRRLVKGAHNYMLLHLAPAREGLRWIDVDDPRSRRTDKLQPSKS